MWSQRCSAWARFRQVAGTLLDIRAGDPALRAQGAGPVGVLLIARIREVGCSRAGPLRKREQEK